MDWYEVAIREVIQETPIDRRFVLDLPADAAPLFAFRPGQHVLVRTTAPDGTEVKSALTPSSDPRPDAPLDVTARGRGSFGAVFYEHGAGTRFEATAPRGRFRIELDPARRLVCFAKEHSVTPYRGMVLELARTGHTSPVTLAVEEERPDLLIFREQFEAVAVDHDAFTYVPVVTGEAEGWSGRRGSIDAAVVREVVGDPADVTVYVCGATAFVEPLMETLRSLGVAEEDLHREKWG